MRSITYCSYWKRGGREERGTNKTNKKEVRDGERRVREQRGGEQVTQGELVLVKLVRSSLLTGGWGGLWRYTEAENGLLM